MARKLPASTDKTVASSQSYAVAFKFLNLIGDRVCERDHQPELRRVSEPKSARSVN